MAIVVSVRFKDSGRTYYFDPGNLDLRSGDMVIVDTIHGPELAKVAFEQMEVAESKVSGELKPVLRRAEKDDFLTTQAYDYEDIMARCNEKIRQYGLDMSLVKAEYSYGSRLTFYFTAEQRVDFRLLVRDLARTFKTRIELRQIGPRDEAKLLGGVGICGRMLCCSTFLPDYTRVSIKMAKDQDLPLNPAKISGICNRLLCCLSYEHQQYLELKADLPRRGTWVETIDGKGHVVEVNVLQQRVTVQLASSGMQEQYPIADIREIHTPTVEEQQALIEEEKELAAARRADRLQTLIAESLSFLSDDDQENQRLLAQFESEGSPRNTAKSRQKQASSRTSKPKRKSSRPKQPSSASAAPSSTSSSRPSAGDSDAGNKRTSKRRRKRPPPSSSTSSSSPSPATSSQQTNRERKPDTRSRPKRRRTE